MWSDFRDSGEGRFRDPTRLFSDKGDARHYTVLRALLKIDDLGTNVSAVVKGFIELR